MNKEDNIFSASEGELDFQEVFAEKSEKEKLILQAAIKAFGEKGFNGTTTKEIAQEAGVAEGTIFRYFKTKKDILVAIVASSLIKAASPYVFNPVEKILKDKIQPIEKILTDLIHDRLSLAYKNMDILKVVLNELQYHPDIKEMFVEHFPMKGIKLLGDFIKDKARQGEFREDVDPEIAARALAGMVGVFILWDQFLEASKFYQIDEDKTVDTIIDIFLHGVAKK